MYTFKDNNFLFIIFFFFLYYIMLISMYSYMEFIKCTLMGVHFYNNLFLFQ
jgi:hypothetical protein